MDTKEKNVIVSEELKKLRESSFKSQTAVAAELGWTVSKLSRIESGVITPSLVDLKSLVDYYGISLSDFFKGSGAQSTLASKNEILRSALINALDTVNLIKSSSEEEESMQIVSEVPRENYDNFITGLPKAIYTVLDKNHNYTIKSSLGATRISEVVWTLIADSDITKGAQKGIYIVYLFLADGSGFYLSLNQGYTYFSEHYKGRKCKQKMAEFALYIRQNCCVIPAHLQLNSINLNAKGQLAAGYEPGHIAGKFYSTNDIPSEQQLVQDLKDLLNVYDQIVGSMGNHNVENFYNLIEMKLEGYYLTEEETIEAAEKLIKNKRVPKNVPTYEGKKPKKSPIEGANKTPVYPRDPNVVISCLEMANYEPFFETKDTFISKVTGKKYVEIHHLLPMAYQHQFEWSLDIVENCVCLSNFHHALLHHGTDAERQPLLLQLYEARKDLLREAGIEVTFEVLKQMYGITSDDN